MAVLTCSRLTMISLGLFVLVVGSANAQLSENFYSSSCSQLSSTVKSTMQSAISKEARIGASILRLFFHDCFVNVSQLSFYSWEFFPIYDKMVDTNTHKVIKI